MGDFRVEELARLRHSRDCTRAQLPANYDRGGEVMLLGACTCDLDETVGRVWAEVARLTEQLRIARGALEYLSHGAETGKTAWHLSTMAEDALIQMSVVE